MFVCIGSTCGAGFAFVLYEKGVGVGRADVQPDHGAIFAGPCRFRHDGRNMAFSPRGL